MANYSKFTNLQATGDLKAQTISGVSSLVSASLWADNIAGTAASVDTLTVANAITAPGMAIWKYLGQITFTRASGSPLKLGTVPAGYIVTDAMCEVVAAFNAGDSNTLVLGTSGVNDALMATADINEGASGLQQKAVLLDARAAAADIYATYTQVGTAATTGAAKFWVRMAKL